MDDKHAHIVTAATEMFARYGYSRTTMSDIAQQAGVARQTVYNAFASKDDILRAVVRHAGDKTHSEVMAAWSETEDVDGRFEAFHRLGPLSWFEAIRQAPDWAELLDGMHKVSAAEMAAQDTQWKASFFDMLSDVYGTADFDTPLSDVVEFFYSASLNAKHGVNDIEALARRLGVIRKAARALLPPDPATR